MLLVDTKVDVQYKNGGVRMEKVPKSVFTKEFKEEAVKMVIEGQFYGERCAHEIYWCPLLTSGVIPVGYIQRARD